MFSFCKPRVESAAWLALPACVRQAAQAHAFALAACRRADGPKCVIESTPITPQDHVPILLNSKTWMRLQACRSPAWASSALCKGPHLASVPIRACVMAGTSESYTCGHISACMSPLCACVRVSSSAERKYGLHRSCPERASAGG